MKSNYLFPNRFRKIGWILFIPGIFLGIMFLFSGSGINFLDTKVLSIAEKPIIGKTVFFSLSTNNILDELASLFLIIGALFIAFSKQKHEDEFISKIRLESLVWATYVNYIVLIISLLFIYDMIFFWVIVFNIFTILIFFIFRFNWVLNKSKNLIRDEE